uniref:Alpha N-terminal protein methyltransferase 1 n=1 Tax=Acrobeloides nanus TaxID=290746 RepID=A0A914CHS5_9BILA
MSDTSDFLENEKPHEIYEKQEKYWASVASDVDGMLGGFEKLHSPDINDSKKFISLLKKNGFLSNFDHAIDCGSGIGRVTKHLLVPIFQKVDMIDVTESFIENSKKYLGLVESKIGQKFISGLQDFIPQENYYDLIWIQWVSGHLTDEDFVKFFQRCKSGIRPGGCIVLKENISSAQEKDFDTQDHSWTRPRALILELFKQAGLRVVSDRKQLHFPKGMYEVRMFALVPESGNDE